MTDSNILKPIPSPAGEIDYIQPGFIIRHKINKQCMVAISTFKSLAMGLPGVVEIPHFEKISFRTNNKIFATLDARSLQATLKLNEIDQSIFSAIDANIIYPVNNKWGKQGWTTVELKMVKKNLLKEVLLKAFHTVAKKIIP